MGYRNEGMGFWGLLTILFIIIIVIVGALFYFKVWNLDDTKQKVLAPLQHKEELVISMDVNYDWCQVQELQDSKIIGWSTDYECCIQQYDRFDTCLQRNTTILRCYIGDVGVVHKFGRINGIYLDTPIDYKKFLDVTADKCQSLVYPGELQEINEQLNFQTI